MSHVFHPGEEAVQRRAGVFDTAATLGPRMVLPFIPADFAEFLATQRLIFVASGADDGGVWVSALSGPAGFAVATSPTRVHVRAPIAPDDPLTATLASGSADTGVLALEPMTRSRIRLNGRAHRVSDGLEIDLREVFGNCPKYIQRRRPVGVAEPVTAASAVVSSHLDPAQQGLIGLADTFFVGSRHPERGADASHRGGRPGFVAVSDEGMRLTFPDYQGNTMFQTLGNLMVDPTIGLLFIDWQTGRTLQLTGRAQIIWDQERIACWPKAQRLVDVQIRQVVDRPAGLPLVWEFVEASRLNPEVPPVADSVGHG
jgi:predicted pyridoxine 5'-phosphate oxidase superfamily flavin-nucleotide-binding protein